MAPNIIPHPPQKVKNFFELHKIFTKNSQNLHFFFGRRFWSRVSPLPYTAQRHNPWLYGEKTLTFLLQEKEKIFLSSRQKILSSPRNDLSVLVKKYPLLLIKKILPSFEGSILSKRTNKKSDCGDM